MTILKKIKKNLFLIAILGAYAVLFFIKPSLGIEAVKSSGYYIKEMLLIMPVIFILTALLDMWVPKEKIMQYLGKEAGAKGLLLSFIIGSVSAGPIYAAFPMCVMLHKKGASIRNIIIILSSWAVIKIPMLLNEVKFLGFKFMAIRWVLTVLAIIIFSWITSKFINDKDIPEKVLKETGFHINQDSCMGCSLCVKEYPTLFEMQGKKAVVKTSASENINLDDLQEIVEICPVRAIEHSKK